MKNNTIYFVMFASAIFGTSYLRNNNKTVGAILLAIVLIFYIINFKQIFKGVINNDASTEKS